MRPNELQCNGGVSGGQQYENAAISQRVDQMVVGYLQRMGYEEAAATLSRESPFLPNPGARTAFINDRLHDKTLEEIIRQIAETGGFGVHHAMLDFGAELRNLTSRFTDATARLSCQPGRAIPAQLFGSSRSSRLRANAIQNKEGRSPSSTARAAMELQRISQIGERRYAESSISVRRATIEQQGGIASIAPPPVTHEEAPTSSQESVETTSSRRKPQQPQQWSSMLTHALVEPIVGYMNARPLDAGSNIEVEPQFLEDLDYIISALDYEPEQEGQQPQSSEAFDPAFEQMMHNGEENFPATSLPVDNEEVIEAESAALEQTYQFPNPSPLLSPLPRDVSFRKISETVEANAVVETEKEIEPSSISSLPTQPSEVPPAPRLHESRHLNDKHHHSSHRERRDGNSLKSFTIPKTSKSSPTRRRSSDEKKRNKEKEKREDREKSRDREHDKRRDRDRKPSTRAFSSNYHNVQSDHRDATFDRSVSETDSKKRKERKEKEAERERDREAEKERQKKRNEKYSQQPSSSSSNFQKVSSEDRSHRKEKDRSYGGSDQKMEFLRKRKADEMNKTESVYKIPKKVGTSKPFPPSQSGPLIRESLPSSSSVKSERSEKPERSERSRKHSYELSHGLDVHDKTRFLQPKTHTALLTSMLVNANQLYEKFQKEKEKKSEKNNGDVFEEPAKSVKNKYSYVSTKGYMSAKNTSNKTSPSTEESSADEHAEDTEKDTASEDEDGAPNRAEETPSPEPPEKRRKKNYEYMIDKTDSWDSVLDRLHKKEK